MTKPWENIRLTRERDMMCEYPREIGSKPQQESSKMQCCIGIHDICTGWMDIRQTSTTHNAISCRRCHLRIVVPIDVETFGDLRQRMLVLMMQEHWPI